MKWSKWMHCI